MLLTRLADATDAVAATGSRKEKSALLAELLAEAEGGEIAAAIGLLIGAPRQGAIGVGWATLGRLEVAPAGTPTLTVTDLDRLLDELEVTIGPGSNAARTELLVAFWSRATRGEQEFVRRALIGEVRTGALAGVVTGAAAKAAGVPLALLRRAVMLLGDLGEAATVALVEGADGLNAVDLTVGRPIQPMLATTAADLAEAVTAMGEVQVDWKLDGARIQVHVDGDRVGVYTRNLNDVTARLPQVAALALALPCSSAVLDGEVIGFHGDELDGPIEHTTRPTPFQDTMSAFGSDQDPSGADPEPPAAGLRPFFFDLMFLDGASLIDQPLQRRTVSLDHLAPAHLIPRVVTADPDVAARHLAGALAQGHEGVMLKAVDSSYEAGRRGKSWRKVKPVHTLDLVVLAAEWGHGRRDGWLSNIHLGARDPESGELVMVGKTFKGLTDALLSWQTERFLELKTHESSTGHTVHLAPELVVEIAVDGAQTSTRYPGGVALRFARVRGYRPDKGPADVDTLDAVRALL